jgi:hypothetical protein
MRHCGGGLANGYEVAIGVLRHPWVVAQPLTYEMIAGDSGKGALITL